MSQQMDVRNTVLITAVYSQSWPAPDPQNTPRKGFIGSHQLRSTSPKPKWNHTRPNFINNQRPSSSHGPVRHRAHPPHPKGGAGRDGRDGSHGNQMLTINGRPAREGWEGERSNGVIRSTDLPLHLGLDKGTLQWKSWSSFQEDFEPKTVEKDDLSLYKITQDTFRKLTQQVQETSLQLNGHYTSPGFQGVRRSQLAASLPSSHASIQNHKERSGDMDKFQSELAVQCTPYKESPQERPRSHLATSRRNKLRPPTRPQTSKGRLSSSDSGHYDQLSPRIMNHLQTPSDVDGGGDRTSTDGEENLGPFNIVKNGYKLGQSESDSSDSEDLAITLVTDENVDGEDRSIAASMEMDSSEDEEEINERMERMRKHRQKMEKKLMRMDLPPEILTGNIDCMFPYRGSSASKKKKQDPFPDALSEPYCHMDLLELSMLDKDWRTIIRTAPDKDDAILMERMIEMEMLQYETAELEGGQGSPRKRAGSSLQARKGWNADAAIPTERAHSALAKPKQTKNCCNHCLQLVCAGDCPNRDAATHGLCVHCRQPYCNGACTEFGYHMHVRYARQEEKKKRRPKSCTTCRRSRTPNNVINTNNVILGRPRSGFATYSSSRVQSAKSRKMKCASSAGAEQVSDRLENLRLSATKYEEKSEDEDGGGDAGNRRRPATAGSRRHIRGRDAMISGKSFKSQRRVSLTSDPVSTTAASMNPKILRVRSAHYRTRKARQKSARRAKKK